MTDVSTATAAVISGVTSEEYYPLRSPIHVSGLLRADTVSYPMGASCTKPE